MDLCGIYSIAKVYVKIKEGGDGGGVDPCVVKCVNVIQALEDFRHEYGSIA